TVGGAGLEGGVRQLSSNGDGHASPLLINGRTRTVSGSGRGWQSPSPLRQLDGAGDRTGIGDERVGERPGRLAAARRDGNAKSAVRAVALRRAEGKPGRAGNEQVERAHA